MADPSIVLYQLPDACIDEIKISPGIMLIMQRRSESHLPLQIRCIETGDVVSEVSQDVEKGEVAPPVRRAPPGPPCRRPIAQESSTFTCLARGRQAD